MAVPFRHLEWWWALANAGVMAQIVQEHLLPPLQMHQQQIPRGQCAICRKVRGASSFAQSFTPFGAMRANNRFVYWPRPVKIMLLLGDWTKGHNIRTQLLLSVVPLPQRKCNSKKNKSIAKRALAEVFLLHRKVLIFIELLFLYFSCYSVGEAWPLTRHLWMLKI